VPPFDDSVIKIVCPSCGAEFPRARYAFDFTPPPAFRARSPVWEAWDQIQANGLSGYLADPERNLSVGERDDCDSFRRFARCRGVVLDVGCGPQVWPAYFDRSSDLTYVGIDPLADINPAEFLKFVGLGEFLPFVTGTFDHVLFSTTLDHFVDPAQALIEAGRVLKPTGEIDVWLGEKDAAAPKPAVSPEWYHRLKRPELADDLFHIKRMNDGDFQALVGHAGLTIVDGERHQIDAYRANCFYRLRARK
jgi:SAM-dependent methyltransferase